MAQDADWTGFYAGAGLWSSSLNTEVGSADFSGMSLGTSYLKDYGSFVLGGEIGYLTESAKEDPEVKWNTTALKAIVGYDLGKSLVFASAGTADVTFETPMGGDSGDFNFFGIGARHVILEKYVAGIEFTRATPRNEPDASGRYDTVTIRLDYKF